MEVLYTCNFCLKNDGANTWFIPDLAFYMLKESYESIFCQWYLLLGLSMC